MALSSSGAYTDIHMKILAHTERKRERGERGGVETCHLSSKEPVFGLAKVKQLPAVLMIRHLHKYQIQL